MKGNLYESIKRIHRWYQLNSAHAGKSSTDHSVKRNDSANERNIRINVKAVKPRPHWRLFAILGD